MTDLGFLWAPLKFNLKLMLNKSNTMSATCKFLAHFIHQVCETSLFSPILTYAHHLVIKFQTSVIVVRLGVLV